MSPYRHKFPFSQFRNAPKGQLDYCMVEKERERENLNMIKAMNRERNRQIAFDACIKKFRNAPKGQLDYCMAEKERERAMEEARTKEIITNICRPIRTDFGWTICHF